MLPQGALVFGRGAVAGPSIMDAVLDDAGAALGRRLNPVRLSARGGVMLAFCERELVRVAVGPGRGQVEAQRSALESLREANPPAAVARLVPWPMAAGRTGLAEWTVEPLMPGAPARGVEGPLMEECLDFLAGLHSLGGAPSSLAGAAEVVAQVCGPAEASAVRAAAARLDTELAGVPRSFGHGDFFAENLLVAGGRLAGRGGLGRRRAGALAAARPAPPAGHVALAGRGARLGAGRRRRSAALGAGRRR